MLVKIWGARGSIPCSGQLTHYFGGNTACVSVVTDAGTTLVFDAGSGIRALGSTLVAQAGARSLHIAIFLSHFHWDHILGIPFFRPLYRSQDKLAFFSFRHAAKSLQDVVESTMSAPYFPVPMGEVGSERAFFDVSDQCIQLGAVHLLSRRLNHPQGCLGYRVECGGRVITYASDHEPDGGVCDRNLFELAAGADLLILDAQYTPGEYEGGRRGWGHSTWEFAVETARTCAVSQLLLFHHDPERSDVELQRIVRQAQRHFPGVEAAAEGMEIYLAEHYAYQEQVEKPAQAGDEWNVRGCSDHSHPKPTRARWAS